MNAVDNYLWNSSKSIPVIELGADKDIISLLEKLSMDEKNILISEPNNSEIKIPERLEKEINSKLIQAPGFLLLRFSSAADDETLRLLYALLCRSIGGLNNRYGYFFDVIDQGLDYTKAAVPVSKTKASTGFHTDSTAKEYLPDVVGLLCLQPGQKGGESQVTNAADLYKHLQNNFPDALIELSKPIIRDVITPGTVNNTEAILENAFPVFSIEAHKLTFRYMRFWIESAHQKTRIPLNEKLLAGLDEIDHFFSKAENLIQFKMNRGELLFLNNRFLCHSRTNFEDAPENNTVRRMVRAWINFDFDLI
jgi:alpha-ketoglutarate-dependent taurine dioxygenase